MIAVEQDGAHSTDANGDSAPEPAQAHLKENGSAEQDSSTLAGAEQKSTELASAPGTNGLDLYPSPRPEEGLQGAAADSASEASDKKQPPLSDKEREVVDGGGGEKGGFKFSKGAYFIGKAVWGKVPTLQCLLLYKGHGKKAHAVIAPFERLWKYKCDWEE